MQTSKASTFGRYEILTELGRGSMGIVYKAYDPKINRPVAIKTFSLVAADATEEQACRIRFFREAEAAGRLSHPRIVAIFDICENPDTLSPYIVMEYVAGRSLEEILSTEGTSMPFDTALRLIQEVAEALDYGHLQGVVHRDVKPSNIIIGEDGHPKIADFGIAQLNVSGSTRSGRVWGTPAYMSPEQFKGESVDGRSDLFSLGVILYRMLTGHRPFQGNSALTLSLKVVNQDPVPPTAFNTGLSPELDCVIARAIAKNRAERYQTGMEMALDLQRLQNRRELERRGDGALLQEDDGTDQAAELKEVFFSPSTRSKRSAFGTGSSPRDGFAKSDKITTPLHFSRPWQQLCVGLLSLGSLVLAFVGLWRAIPISAVSAAANMTSNPPLESRSVARIASEDLTVAESLRAPGVQLSVKNPAREVYPNNIHQSNSLSFEKTRSVARIASEDLTAFLTGSWTLGAPAAAREVYPDTVQLSDSLTSDQSLSCYLGIAVQHHFVTADLSVWIDDQPSYSHSLRGAIKKRVMLFKGVEGYLSDIVHLTPGDHIIRVRVLSEDGSYDESGSISGTFAPGDQQLLAIDFDKHNRRMRLTFAGANEF
jgi:serine/threonine protein kinase